MHAAGRLLAEREGIQGGLSAKAVGPRLATVQGDVDDLERQIAEVEARIASAALSPDQIGTIEQAVRKGVELLQQQPWEVQKRVLAGLVVRVEVAAGAPLAVQLGVPLGQVRTEVREWCVI